MPANNTNATYHSNGEDSSWKLAQNIATRFKREDRFSGKVDEDMNEFNNNYPDASSDYQLSEIQHLKYIQNLFDSDAKRFFRNNVADRAAIFQKPVS